MHATLVEVLLIGKEDEGASRILEMFYIYIYIFIFIYFINNAVLVSGV